MKLLSKADSGTSYSIKWMLGLPDVIADFLNKNHMEQGADIFLVNRFGDYVIVNSGEHRLALDGEIASRIYV